MVFIELGSYVFTRETTEVSRVTASRIIFSWSEQMLGSSRTFTARSSNPAYLHLNSAKSFMFSGLAISSSSS